MIPRLVLKTLLIFTLLLQSRHASADARRPVYWNAAWTKVQPVEYGITLGVGLTTLGVLTFTKPRPATGGRGFLYDDALRSALRAESRDGRDHARLVSDLGYRFLLAYPFLDAGITAGLVHRNGEVAWQMLAMDAEALTLAGGLGVLSAHLTGRARPSRNECKKDPEYEAMCNKPDESSSFFSSHTAVATAAAGVTCAHHLNMDLYANRVADVGACVFTSVVATVTGVARIINDRHWATDVTVGFLIGAATGLGIPLLVHYDGRASDRMGTAAQSPTAAARPGNLIAQFGGVF